MDAPHVPPRTRPRRPARAGGQPVRKGPAPVPQPEPAPWPPDPSELRNPALYINRELSWLAFNERVLAQAQDESHPVLERVKFLAIVGTNLDEFYMVRVSTMIKQLEDGTERVSPDGLNTSQQLVAMRERAARILAEQANCWHALRGQLVAAGIRFLDRDDWTPAVRQHLRAAFVADILPVLTPLAFDPGHPFPFISNLSKNFAVVVRHEGRTKFARVKLPDILPRFVPVPDHVAGSEGTTFAFLEDVVRDNIQALFPQTQVKGAYLFRVVRDTDLEIEQDEADDLLESIDRSLRELRRGALALLQVASDMPARILDILKDNFEIGEETVLRSAERVGFGDWMQLLQQHRPELKDPVFTPKGIWTEHDDPEVIFDQIKYHDQLVHHPFQSFDAVEAFLRAAIRDRQVIAIKMTLYRIGANSPLIDLLIDASEAGKQVAVLVELKARFDERNNIIWARRLESHGVHVVYGFAELKTHAKLCLVVRKEAGGIQRYVHTATGNYNPGTARVYTDLGLFTADADIVSDVSEVFNYLTGYSNQKEFRRLLVAPVQLRQRLAELVEREAEHARAGRPARLIVKVNAVTDDQMIRVLYRASQAGLEIDLIVRGICSLRPGIPGVSETIRVRSIVGRFLEHSRLYWFENGGEPELYLGSADLMERNLDRRVEVLTPVRDRGLAAHLREVALEAYLRDTVRARVLGPDGTYSQPAGDAEPFDAQLALLQHYTEPRVD